MARVEKEQCPKCGSTETKLLYQAIVCAKCGTLIVKWSF